MKNFVEYRWRDPEEREVFANDILNKQQTKKKDMIQKLEKIKDIDTSESDYFIPSAPKNKGSNFIKIEDDVENPSPLNNGITLFIKDYR